MVVHTQSVIKSQDISSLQTIIDTIPVATLMINSEGVIIDCNKTAVSQFLAEKPEDILGKNPDTLSPPFQRNGKESREGAFKWIQKAQQKRTVSFYWDHKRLNGEIYPAKVTLTALVYEGEPCLMASIVDISGQALVEENEALVNENPYAVIVLNPDLTIMDVNPAFCRISGYKRDEWITKHLTEFTIIRRDGPTADDAIKTRKTVAGKIIVQFATGIRHMEYSYIPVFDSEGELLKVYDIFADLTEMTEQLHESESLITQSPASICTYDIKGRILGFNKSFQDMTQIPKTRLMTMNAEDFTLISRQGATFSEVLSTKKPGKGSMIVDFGDRIKVLEYTYIPVLDVNDSIQKLISVYIDLTEQTILIEEIKTFISENPYAIFTLDPDCRLIDVNPAFSKMSGYSPEQLLKMRVQDFHVIEQTGQAAGDAFKTGTVSSGKIVLEFPTGIRHMEYIRIPIKDPRGNVHKLMEIFADQTNLIEKLNESESQVADNPAGIFTIDLNGKILSTNKSFIDITQFSESRLLSMNIKDFNVIAREGITYSEAISAKKHGNGTLTIDFGTHTKILDYTYIPILDVNNNVSKMFSMYIDVTTIKKMVSYLEQSVGSLNENLSALSHGDTNFTTRVLDADPEIAEAKNQFITITQAVDTAREAIARLVRDSTSIASAVLAGDLSFRVDQMMHEGDYRKVIEGMNQTQDSIEIPVREALRVSQEYANYQFKARVNPSLKVAGDWVEFKNALDNIGIQISGAVGLINRQLLDLSSNAEEATASIGEVSAGAEQIAKSAGEVSRNADIGQDGISQVLKAMEDLTITVSEVSLRAEQVSTAAVQANEFSKKGIELAKNSDSSMTEITRSSNEVDLIVKEINAQMEEIGKIVRLISDIANQTNLLALNAAIEAARAGEAGRGFAVVAAEVKSLAQDSRRSAENIADMITTLQDKAQKATIAMTHAEERVLEGTKSLAETLGAFNQIASSIDDITRNAMDVASASEEQAASVEEVTASIHEVSSLIINTTKEAGDAATASKEASVSINQITRVVTNVSGIADSISREMSKFVV